MEVFNFMPYTYYTRMTVSGGKYPAESGQPISGQLFLLYFSLVNTLSASRGWDFR